MVVFIDYGTAIRCQPSAQATLRARCADVTPRRPRYVVCPRGESADEYLLRHARAEAGLVISNDRYFDHEELRKHVITIQFRMVRDTLTMAEEATWFRSPGVALRVELATLRQLRGDQSVDCADDSDRERGSP